MSDIKDNSTIVSMSRDVAVIGVGGRFPKADNIAEFYQNLKSSVDCVTEIDSERIQNTSIDHANYEIMGFLDDVDKFDYQFFNISKGEAELMDPHQRIMLEAVHETIESAGYSIEEFSNRITNLYVSSPIPAYYLHMNRIEAPAIIGNLPGISAGRIARHFNFTGNAALIDTTCSSSLVSIHMGYNDLIFNEADQVVVTGARISLFPSKKNGKSPLGIVSPDGKDRAFSADANGTSTGEACGVVILKRLDLAISDGDNILGIIKSTAVNQDADRSAFLTAPSKKAQTEVISKAWEKAEIDPRTVSFIEAHGTGTKLGDPIEIDALNEAFKRYTSDQHFCAVSAVKTNIGHTDAAAGICGFIKSILSLQHKVLFASLHFSEPNPMINFDDSAVYVNDKLKEWKADSDYPRRAGVSAFGMSGTNCHLVLEEAKPLTLSPSGLVDKSGGRYLFPFTSKSSNGLTEYLESFQDFLTSDIHTSIEDVSYTLSAGRTHYSHRIAFQAESLDSLRKQIESSLISGIETHKIGIQPSEYIIYFPNAIEDAKELITAFARSSTDYQFYLDECKKHYSDDQSNLLLYSFIFEYCTFKVLESKDLISQNLLGYGVGELAISVILKEMTLQEAIKQVLSYSHDQDDSFYERLGRYLRNMNQNKGTIFLDLGKDSEVEKLMILIERESQKSNIQHSSVTNESTLNGLIIDVKEKLFLGGVPIDWSKQYVKGGRKRVQLPTYKFQKERCWVKPPTMPGVTDHFYELVWKLQERSNDGEALENEVLLIFGANNDLSQNAVSLLNDSNTCIVVDHSQSFNKNTHIQYEINYHSEEDYFQLRESLKNDQISITGILHFGNYTPDFVSDSKSITSDFGLGLQSQFFIAKAFEDYLDSKSFHLSFISSFGQYIEGDTAHIPAHAASVAFIKSLVSNNPHLKARSIDLEYSPLLTPDNAQFILDEIRDNDTIKVVACRNGTRYVQELCKIEKSSFGTNDDKLPKDNEVYLITGGASGIGLSLANFLADNNKPCDIIILGRREVSNDVNPELYEGLLELEAKCRTVKYIAVDVSDKKGMDRAFSEIKQSYNQIAGVIHAAGVPGEWAKLSEKEFGDFSKTLDAKVQGSLLIYEHTSDLNPEYIAFCSSLNAIVPQRLSSEYAVANAFQDALATHLSQFSNQKVISIGWPGWKEIGMGVTDSKTNDEIGPLPLKRINTKDGLIAFDYATRLNKTHVLVADVDLSSFRINPFFNISSSENQQTVEVVNNTVASRPRVISTKDSIINIWKEVLKIDDISEKDDFFDLGGNSLNGTQVINHLDKQFEVDLEFEVLLENPRADELAAFIDDLKRNVGQDSVKEIKILEEQQYYRASFKLINNPKPCLGMGNTI
ncbi:MAG: SDR family NAD(P)-dependent oxidoreductase, partial [Bacteroidota bacterium]